jgi:hypothetical protein
VVTEALPPQALLVALAISLEPLKTRWVTKALLKDPGDHHALARLLLTLTHPTLRNSHQIEVDSFLPLYRIIRQVMVVHCHDIVDLTAMPLVFPTTFLAPRQFSHPHIYRKRATPSLRRLRIAFIHGLHLLARHSGQVSICQQVHPPRSGNMRILETRP